MQCHESVEQLWKKSTKEEDEEELLHLPFRAQFTAENNEVLFQQGWGFFVVFFSWQNESLGIDSY